VERSRCWHNLRPEGAGDGRKESQGRLHAHKERKQLMGAGYGDHGKESQGRWHVAYRWQGNGGRQWGKGGPDKKATTFI
jgi:hypothetical protein